MTIHVIDENDNFPKFTNDTFTFHLPENEPPDSYVGRLTATDRDMGRNAELTFSIATSTNDFTIDPKSGFIKTLRYFDRERLLQTSGQDFVVLEAVVTDNGVSRLRDRARIHVHIMGTSCRLSIMHKMRVKKKKKKRNISFPFYNFIQGPAGRQRRPVVRSFFFYAHENWKKNGTLHKSSKICSTPTWREREREKKIKNSF